MRERCLIARKWVHMDPCVPQCDSCRTILGGPPACSDPNEETPEGLYLADKRRRETGVA